MSNKLTVQDVITRCQNTHNHFYTYEKVVYFDNKTHIEITCPKHGSKWISPSHHMNGKGCKECATEKRAEEVKNLAALQFKEKAKKIHGNFYNYDQSSYVSSTDNISIICPIHGLFEQTPNSHLSGKGCPICGSIKVKRPRLTTQEFIYKAEATHGSQYNYSKSNYTHAEVEVEIICPEHGSFWQLPHNHISGKGCTKCMKTGYNVGKSGFLYILTSGNITKVGITNRDVTKRAKQISNDSGKNFSVYSYICFSDGSVPLTIEQNLLKYLRSEYVGVAEKFNGHSECFYDVDISKIFLQISKHSFENTNKGF